MFDTVIEICLLIMLVSMTLLIVSFAVALVLTMFGVDIPNFRSLVCR